MLSQLLEVVLINYLLQLLFREGELVRVLFVLLLQVRQQQLLLRIVQLIQVHHHLVALFIFLLEILVAFLQAYIFTMLTALFIGMSVHVAH